MHVSWNLQPPETRRMSSGPGERGPRFVFCLSLDRVLGLRASLKLSFLICQIEIIVLPSACITGFSETHVSWCMKALCKALRRTLGRRIFFFLKNELMLRIAVTPGLSSKTIFGTSHTAESAFQTYSYPFSSLTVTSVSISYTCPKYRMMGSFHI